MRNRAVHLGEFRMNWWGWIIAGAILLGAELSFVSAQFYLVFIGSAAIVTGVATLLLPLTPALQWAVFGILAIGSMVAFRSRVYQRFNRALPKVDTGPTGGCITLPVSLGAGESCQAEYGGTFWTVRNDSDTAMPSGSRARIARVQNLTLCVKPEK
ncbi:MAG TPA: NfeD family protein [Steroidobacteraceae bacterium]|nr:NfeD family protein [Steroidobacteraceae bacterium]